MDYHISASKLSRYVGSIIDGMHPEDRLVIEGHGRPLALLTRTIPHLAYQSIPRISTADFKDRIMHYLEAAPIILTCNRHPRVILVPYHHRPTDVVRIEFDMRDGPQYASILNMLSTHLSALSVSGVHVRLHTRGSRPGERRDILNRILKPPPLE